MLCLLGIIMFTFNFTLINPYKTAWKTLKEFKYPITKTTNCYIGIYKSSDIISVGLSFQLANEISINLGLFGYSIGLDFYTEQDWDYTNHCWKP